MQERSKEQSNWPHILGRPFRILKTRGSESKKTDPSINLTKIKMMIMKMLFIRLILILRIQMKQSINISFKP